MKHLPLFFLFSFFIVQFIHGQRLHEPSQVLKIMEESKVNYVFDISLTTSKQNRFNNIGQKSEKLIRIVTDTEIRLDKSEDIPFNKKISKKLKKGEKEIKKGRYEKARKHLTKALTLNSSDLRLINKMGESYHFEGNYPTAIYWYDKTLELNSVETDALVSKARSLLKNNQQAAAESYVTLAHLFNRNDKTVKDAMLEIFQTTGKKYIDKSFSPDFQISVSSDRKKVDIGYGHSIWAAYAAVYALWENEEGYEEKMSGISKQPIGVIKEKEAVLNALLTYEGIESSQKGELFPFMELLSRISTKGQIDNFILYEIYSRRDPLLPLLLTDKKLESLKNYVLKHRISLK